MAENWGGLNNALFAFKKAVDVRLPGRSTKSDGARADAAHGSSSQHQEDSDGTVDAFDMDVNVLASSTSTGTAAELRIIEAIKKDFERDNRAHLWIHNREIAQHDHGWTENYYGGSSPHTEHAHWEARQDRETNGAVWNMPNLDALLEEMFMPSPEEYAAAVWSKANDSAGATTGTHLSRAARASMLETTGTSALKDVLQMHTERFLALESVQGDILIKLSEIADTLAAAFPPPPPQS